MPDPTQDAPQTQERDFSLSELDNAVAQGQITQQQRDQIWTNQVQRGAMKTAETVARTVVETEQRVSSIDSEIQQYAAVAPDVMKEGSPLRQRVHAEYQYLTGKGAPADLTTELAAIRAVMGPVERVKAHAQGKRRDADAFGDTSRSAMTPEQRKETEAWDKLNPRQKSHYDDLIRKRIYPDRAAALGELKRAAERRVMH